MEGYGDIMAKNIEPNTKDVKKNEVDEKKENTKPVTNKIFIIVFVVGIIILLGIYIYKSVGTENKEDMNNSYLLTSNTINLELKNLNEVSQVMAEAPQQYFVLISYTGDENAYNLEKDLKKVIDKYKLNDAFYYYDAKELKESGAYLELINKTFKSNKIKKIPAILYIKGNKVIDVVSRNDDNMIKVGDFQKLLDIYDF